MIFATMIRITVHIFILCLLALCLNGLSTDVYAQVSAEKFVSSAMAQTKSDVTYDGRYFKIPYPDGDIPTHLGVCTDVVIRAYRTQGIDLQELVHEDMKAHFRLYPKLWQMKGTDTNIDHRRVPNLQVFFKRHGKSLSVTNQGSDYKPGDLVTWNLRSDGGSLPHIGIVTDQMSHDGKRPLIVHNIGQGPKLEDMIFDYKITGHYRYGL